MEQDVGKQLELGGAGDEGHFLQPFIAKVLLFPEAHEEQHALEIVDIQRALLEAEPRGDGLLPAALAAREDGHLAEVVEAGVQLDAEQQSVVKASCNSTSLSA